MPSDIMPSKTFNASSIVPSQAPIKTIQETERLDKAGRSLHTPMISTKYKKTSDVGTNPVKTFISKSAEAPDARQTFPEIIFQSELLKKRLSTLLNGLSLPAQAPLLATSAPGPQKISVESLFTKDPLLRQRLKNVVSIISIADSATEDVRSLFNTIDKAAETKLNVIQRDIRSLFKGMTEPARTQDNIIRTFEIIERSVLKMNRQAQIEMISNLSKSQSTSSLSEMVSISDTISSSSRAGSIDSLDNTPQQQEVTVVNIKKNLAKEVDHFIFERGIELMISNLSAAVPAAVRPAKNIVDHIQDMALMLSAQEDLSAAEKLKIIQRSAEWSAFAPRSAFLKSLFESYVLSAEIVEKERFVPRILNELEKPSPAYDLVKAELRKAAELPYHRTVYLKESADAQREVLAQELMRALAPISAIGANPYPKYRIATSTQSEYSGLAIVPNIPILKIASEQIDFAPQLYRTQYNSRTNHLEESTKANPLLAHLEEVGGNKVFTRMDEIPGFGATFQFAKYLGNTDAKMGNIGIRQGNGADYPTVVTSIDAGLCFGVNPKVFKDIREIETPSLITQEERAVCHYMFQRTNWQVDSEYDAFFHASINNPQVQKENRITALHIALLPPELYETFANQYLSAQENPFLRNHDPNPNHFNREHSYHSIVKEHLIDKADSTYHHFITNNRLFSYFLDDARTDSENIFKIYQDFVLQLEAFRFYEKRDFNMALTQSGAAQSLSNMMNNRFCDFIAAKAERMTPEERTKLIRLLEKWDPGAINHDDKILPRNNPSHQLRADQLIFDNIENAVILKEQLGNILVPRKEANLCAAATIHQNTPVRGHHPNFLPPLDFSHIVEEKPSTVLTKSIPNSARLEPITGRSARSRAQSEEFYSSFVDQAHLSSRHMQTPVGFCSQSTLHGVSLKDCRQKLPPISKDSPKMS